MKLVNFIVTFFFIGNFRIGPGSIASLVTVILFYFFEKNLNGLLFILMIFLTTIISYFAIRVYTIDLKEKDKSEIVIDEVIGQSIALLPILLFIENNNTPYYLYVTSFLFSDFLI